MTRRIGRVGNCYPHVNKIHRLSFPLACEHSAQASMTRRRFCHSCSQSRMFSCNS